MLYYKSNGRKAIKGEATTTTATSEESKSPSGTVTGSEGTAGDKDVRYQPITS